MADLRSSDRRMFDSDERERIWEAAMVRWNELREALSLAQTMRLDDPDYPAPKIGRFEGMTYMARGGFGVVFLVRDPELDREVVVKFSILDAKETHELLLREARLMAKLSHPNLVTVYEVGRYGDTSDAPPFFVMEHIEGETAHEFIKREPKPSWSEIAVLYRGAGAGLAAAHERGVVHGDFKPENILIDANDWPRVTDFGFAHYDTSGDEDGGEGLCGTWAYMAPEVLEGQDPDHLSDQFSFCVSLWLTLDGAYPFAVRDGPAKMHRAIYKGPRVHDRQVPEQLRAIARRGLAIEPRERFSDMSAVVGELDRALVELRAGEPTAPAPEFAQSPAESSPLLELAPPAAESSTQLGLVPSQVSSPTRERWIRRRPFATHIATNTLTAAMLLLLFRSQLSAQLAAEEPEVEVVAELPSEDKTEEPKDEAEPGSKCSSQDASLVSEELESACELIRAGEFSEAEVFWVGVRDRSYKEIEEGDNDGLEDIGDKTRIVADTFDRQADALQRSNPSEAKRARLCATGMRALYAEDYAKMEPSASGDDEGPT